MKTTLEIDKEKVRRVAAILGTKTTTATVDAALDEIERNHKMRALIERAKSGAFDDLADPETRVGLWR